MQAETKMNRIRDQLMYRHAEAQGKERDGVIWQKETDRRIDRQTDRQAGTYLETERQRASGGERGGAIWRK